jgi:hypothetical protein
MTKCLPTSTAFALLTCLAATSAAEPYRPQVVPQCEVYDLADGREVCGYVVKEADGTETLDQWKEVLQVDAELVVLRHQDGLRRRKLAELSVQASGAVAALVAAERALEVVELRNADLTRQLVETDRKYQQERVKPRIGVGWAWAAAGLVAAGLVGYVAADQL